MKRTPETSTLTYEPPLYTHIRIRKEEMRHCYTDVTSHEKLMPKIHLSFPHFVSLFRQLEITPFVLLWNTSYSLTKKTYDNKKIR